MNMQAASAMNYTVQPSDFREQTVKMGDAYQPRRDDTPDHLTVGNVANLLANDVRQLLEEIAELRTRLSPILAEPKTKPLDRRGPPPVACKLGAELADVVGTLQQCRELVQLTLTQLDL